VAVWPPSVPGGSLLEAQSVPSRRAEPASSRACHGWEKTIGRDGPHAVVTNVRVEPMVTEGVIRLSHFSTSFRSGRAETALFFPCYLQPHCFFPVVYNGEEADIPSRLPATQVPSIDSRLMFSMLVLVPR
jgi:hypothetical protein